MVTSSVTVRIRGDKEVNRYLKSIQTKTPTEGKMLTKRLAQFIVRSAKQRVAPMKSGTGRLMRSIIARPSAKGYVVTAGEGIKRPYAYYQEFGFKTHSVPISKLPRGSRLYQELKAGGVRGRILIRWRKEFQYMEPAFRRAITVLDTELNRTANKIIRG